MPDEKAVPCPVVALEFRDVYDRYFGEVCRWLRALGGPSSDVEDLAQEVFVIARRKFDGFDGANPGGWLYRIAERVAANARRRVWFRRLFQARATGFAVESLPHGGPGPADLLERKQAEAMLHRLLARMSEKRRVALILSEIEGLSGEEIARLQRIPVGTVRTRLFHARREFLELVARLQREEIR